VKGGTDSKGYVTNEDIFHQTGLYYTNFLVNGTSIIQVSSLTIEEWT
jgi:hypothetical protein